MYSEKQTKLGFESPCKGINSNLFSYNFISPNNFNHPKTYLYHYRGNEKISKISPKPHFPKQLLLDF